MNKKLISFDLDGVLADSKQPIPQEVADMLARLGRAKYNLAIISGCSWKQMDEQVRMKLVTIPEFHKNLYFLPTSGSQIYTFGGSEIFKDQLTLPSKALIWTAWEVTGWRLPVSYGSVEEDRDSQITFSLLGQQAPLKEKEQFYKDRNEDRKEIALQMQKFLNQYAPGFFSVRTGGLTSIDVTYANRDKSFGMTQILKHLNLEKTDALYFGDALSPEGNDYPVFELGIECISVTGYEDTLTKVKIALAE